MAEDERPRAGNGRSCTRRPGGRWARATGAGRRRGRAAGRLPGAAAAGDHLPELLLLATTSATRSCRLPPQLADARYEQIFRGRSRARPGSCAAAQVVQVWHPRREQRVINVPVEDHTVVATTQELVDIGT